MKDKKEKGNSLAFWLLLACVILGICLGGACSGRFRATGRQNTEDASVRTFPQVRVPNALMNPADRLEWLADNFWTSFTDPDKTYVSDSAVVNGVLRGDVDMALLTYAEILEQIPLEKARKSMVRFFQKIANFQDANPESNLFSTLVRSTESIFYDPNSPLRNEDLYLPFVQELVKSPLVEDVRREGYARDARICSLNQVGSPAADFSFITSKGRQMRLRDIKADNVLLFFSNPGCPACGEITAAIEGNPAMSALISSGRLAVVNMYIDEDVEAWKEYASKYPSTWIVGYDIGHVIRSDELYAVRAIPSLYLLDSKGNVVLKDVTVEKLVATLQR